MNSVHDGGHAYRVFDKQGSVCLYSSEEPCLCCGKTPEERERTDLITYINQVEHEHQEKMAGARAWARAIAAQVIADYLAGKLRVFPSTAYHNGEPIIAALPNPMRQP